MIKKILTHTTLVLIVLFGSFYLALQVHFPTETLQKRLQYEVQKNSKDTLFVNIEKTSTNGLGIVFSEVQVLQKEKNKEEATELFFSPQVTVDTPFFSLLMFKPQALLESEIFGGILKAEVSIGKKNRISVIPTLQNLNAALLPLYGDIWDLSFLGSINVSGALNFPMNKFKKTKGKLKFTGKNLQLEEGKILIKKLPPMNFTEANIELNFSKGKATIKEGILSSEELQIEIGGHIKLNNSPLKSKLYLTLKIETGEELDKLIGTLGKPYQDEQGMYNIKILGRVSTPRIQTSGKKPKKSTRSKPKANFDMDREEENIDPLEEGDTPKIKRPKVDDEGREEKRQERIERARQRREERLKKRKVGKQGFDRIMPTPRILPQPEINNDDESEEEPSDEEGDEDSENDNSDEGEPSDEEE
jgi:type II secretion system protein N